MLLPCLWKSSLGVYRIGTCGLGVPLCHFGYCVYGGYKPIILGHMAGVITGFPHVTFLKFPLMLTLLVSLQREVDKVGGLHT